MKRLKKGFTLIELLVVIAIIAILATVVIINVTGARAKAARAKVSADMDVAAKIAAACVSFDGALSVPPVAGSTICTVAGLDLITDTVEKATATGSWPTMPTNFAFADGANATTATTLTVTVTASSSAGSGVLTCHLTGCTTTW